MSSVSVVTNALRLRSFYWWILKEESMPVTLILRKKEYTVEGTITVKDALKQLGLSSESHLVVRDGQLLTENDALRNGEVVKLVAVISGG